MNEPDTGNDDLVEPPEKTRILLSGSEALRQSATGECAL